MTKIKLKEKQITCVTVAKQEFNDWKSEPKSMILTLLPIGGLCILKDFGVAHCLSISLKKKIFVYFVLTLFFLNNFYWSIVDL